MKILCITNLYPPYYFGGYELACFDVVEGLKKRGHKVYVITSYLGYEGPFREGDIFRILRFGSSHFDPWRDFLRALFREIQEYRKVKGIVKKMKPDLLLFFNLNFLAINIIAIIKRVPSCFYIFDRWMQERFDSWRVFWEMKSVSIFKRIIKNILKGIISNICIVDIKYLRINNFVFATNFLKNEYIDYLNYTPKLTEVIYYGIEEEKYKYFNKGFDRREKIKILFVGRLRKEKGIETLLKSIKILTFQMQIGDMKVIIVGEGALKYEEEIRNFVSANRLDGYVNFAGKKRREEIVDFYKRSNILIFPSEWEEPFGMVILEAFATGIPVIVSPGGGNREILKDRENCLIFKRGDSYDLAEKIKYLIDHPDLAERIRGNARKLVEERFTLKKMIDEVEGFLYKILRKKG